MKVNELKKLIKQSVKEAFQEELKDLLLESIKSNKGVVTESFQPTPQGPKIDRKAMYEAMIGGMGRGKESISLGTQDLNNFGAGFNPGGALPGGDLPQGNVSLDQIMGLLNTK